MAKEMGIRAAVGVVAMVFGFGGGWFARQWYFREQVKEVFQEAFAPKAGGGSAPKEDRALAPSPSASAEADSDKDGQVKAAKMQEVKALLAKRAKENEPLRFVTAKIGPGPYDVGRQIDTTMENTTKDKTIVAFEAVAYGFTAFEDPTNLHLRSFGMKLLMDTMKIAPGKKEAGSWKLYTTNAASVLIEVSRVKFSDGTTWARELRLRIFRRFRHAVLRVLEQRAVGPGDVELGGEVQQK